MLKEILHSHNYLPDHIASGFDLVGTAGGSQALPSAFQPASLAEEELLATAESANKAIFFSTRSCGDADVDQQLWDKTWKEKEDGWLAGPIPFEDTQSTGRISRRFPVVQHSKVRPIDNYSESQINDSVTVTNRVTVDGVDTIGAMSSMLMSCLAGHGRSTKLMGRSFDLKSAYRQLAISDSSLKWARIAVYSPSENKAVCFQQYCLPFGARSSVVGFIRCARMLQWLAHQLDLVNSCYFDDYVNISPDVLAAMGARATPCPTL